MTDEIHSASFRDPSGFIFRREGLIHRQVNRRYASEYDQLMGSGLYETLVAKGLLLPHEELEEPLSPDPEHYRTLLPEQLEFVSYPYEWSFSQLKDAALLTLRIQRAALASGMTLRDASAYNVQFQRGRPVFIDTLSFGHYEEGEPWVGYRQFCQHFLAPLALMSRRDVRLSQLLRTNIDGIPLDLAASLLPLRSWLNMGLLMHIRVHSGFQQRYEGEGAQPQSAPTARKLSKSALGNLITALEGTARRLDWHPAGTEWAEYYEGDSYEEGSLEHKKSLVAKFLAAVAPEKVWDFGANTGVYSRIASEQGAQVVSFDVDPACVERNYREVREKKEKRVLPLLLDLVNPSPGIGWANQERETLAQRQGADALLALALIHHIAISNNVPLPHISDFFAALGENLVIEFVPKSDAKVRTLLATREDVFPHYTREGFEAAFSRRWHIEEAVEIEGSQRTLYLLRRRTAPDSESQTPGPSALAPDRSDRE
jgi:ribosomal protein L11 methylase PrmA